MAPVQRRGCGWRRAGSGDAGPLADLERDANLAGLGHVFGDLPFPYDGVLARWALVLEDPDVLTEVLDGVVDGASRLIAFSARGAESLRHLAVHPDHWGRGIARDAVQRAIAAGVSQLWVLDANHRARALYESLGWRPSGDTQECPWVPHPIELDYRLLGSRS